MAMRVTDLERFSLEHVWRPYWPTWLRMHGEEWLPGIHLGKPPMGLHETAERLKVSDRWSDCVIDRLNRCRIRFPSYVMHPLVDVIMERLDQVNGVDRAKAGVPMGISMFEDEISRLRVALVTSAGLCRGSVRQIRDDLSEGLHGENADPLNAAEAALDALNALVVRMEETE